MAPERTAVPFLDSLRASGLLSDAQVAELAKLPEARDPAPNPLARVVLQRGWLTRFQLNTIAAGAAKGLTIGPYLVLDRIGEGGMGMVYKARHQHMQRIVALKVIRKEKLATPDAVNRFLREIQLAGTLHHPNIVLAYDAGPAGNSYYFAMEHVEGVDLARLVKEKGPLPVAQACDYIRQAALGLQHAHKKGLVHRDVKPSNLLVSRDAATDSDVVKLLDMGLARVQGGADTGLTKIGAVIGTPDYLAPEQAMNSKAADIRADLYSLGCSLYYLLTGKPPFTASELTEVLLKHQMEKPVPLAKHGVDVPKKVQAILDRLMAKHPDDRYQTPAELIEDLGPFCCAGKLAGDRSDFRSAEDATEEWVPPAAERSGRRKKDDEAARRKKRLLVLGIAGGALALLLLGLVLYLVFGGPKPEQLAQGTTPAEPTRKGPTETGKAQHATDKGSKPVALPPDGGNKPPVVDNEKFRGHEGDITCVAFCDDGKKIVSGSSDKTIRVWDREGRKEVFPVKQLKAPVASLGVLLDGKTVYVGLTNGAGESLKIDTPGTIGLGSSDGTVVHAIVASPDGRCIGRAGGGIGPQLLVPTPATTEVHGFPDNYNAHSIAFSSDGKQVAVGDDNGTIHLYDVDEKYNTKKLQELLAAHKGPIRGLAFVADSKELISAGEDGKMIAWGVSTGKEVRRYEVPPGPVNSVAISPDGKTVVAAVKNGKIRIWQVGETKPNRILADHNGEVRCVVFSPDGKYLVSCGDTIRLWDLQKP